MHVTSPAEVLRRLPRRLLDEDELTRLVADVAAQEDLWRPLVRHRPEERQCVSLHADEHVGIWVIAWMPGHDTGFHDHAGSCGAVAVAQGRVREERPAWGPRERVTHAAAEDAFSFDALDVHRVHATGDGPAVTIHAYSPPLREMGVYRRGDDGRFHRTAVRWNETLAA